MSFHSPQVFPLISDWSVWHNGSTQCFGDQCHFGCFPLCQRFRKFRSEVKWKGPFRVLPTGIFVNTSRSGVEYPGRNFATETSRSILTNRLVALLLFTFVGNSENEQKMARTIPLGWPGWSDNVVSPLVSDRMVWHKAPNVSQMNTAKINRT